MRTMQHLLAIGIMTLAVMAVAQPASALVVTQEGTGQPCPAVTVSDHGATGGCHGEAASAGPVELRALFGIMYLCNKQFEVRFDGTGHGYLTNLTLTNCNGLRACTEADGHTTVMQGQLSGTSNPWQLEVTFCVVGPFGVVTCHLSGIPVNQISHTTGTAVVGTGVPLTHKFCENSTNAVLGTFNLVAEAGEAGFEVSP